MQKQTWTSLWVSNIIKHKTMNQIFKGLAITLLGITLLACGQKPTQEEGIPEDVDGVRALLKTKKKEASALTLEIEELTKKLEQLDPESMKKAVMVQTEAIEPRLFESFSTFQANVIADEIASASSQMGGTLTSLNVTEGAYVSKGQLIATTNSETLDNQRIEIETSLKLAKNVYERQKRLWDQNIGSELQYLEAKNNKERLEKSLATLGSQIKLKNVYSPISGVVENILIKQGELASPGFPIVQILNTNKLVISADVPDSYLSKVKRGNRVEVNFPALDLKTTKVITKLGNQIDPSNRTFAVEMATGSMGGKIKPNLLAEVQIKEESLKDVISVPTNIIQQEVNGDNYIFIEKDGKALKQKITLGLSNDDRTLIEDGLSIGQKLIVVGGFGLENGSLVEAKPFVAE